MTKPSRLTATDKPSFWETANAPIWVCKSGPAGTYTFSFTGGGTASITLPMAGDPCVRIWSGTSDGFVDVTVTEDSHPGTVLTSVTVTDDGNNPLSFTPTANGATVFPQIGVATLVNFVNTIAPPTATCANITAVQGVAITPVTLTGSGGAGGPYTFSATGLPAGLAISSTGTISGTPTVSGSFTYTVTIADREGHKGTVDCTVTVNPPSPPPTATCASINAAQGVAITPVTLTGSGGTGGPYTFTATGLPAGLSISSNGTISGTPTVSGTFTYTVTVTDKDGHQGTVNCTIVVNPPPQVCTDQNASNFGGPLPCVYPPTPCPDGSFTFTFLPNGDLFIRYDQFPAPNDNSYGVNAVGWGAHGHKFSDLVGSDHAGFQLIDGSGVVQLSFNVDYLTANTSAPSGYASLGVLGGDGKMLVGTSTGISATTSLANNLNNINIPGLFNSSHVQQFGSVNLFVDSPPTDALHQTYNISDPLLMGWDFHDTYFVTISAAKLASIGFDAATWKVEPNPDQLHNSPAKACPVTGGTCDLSVTKTVVTGKQAQVTIANGASTDAILTALSLNWPAATNGKLMQVKLDGDIVYDKPDIAGGTANLTLAQLVADQNKRKINHGTSDVLTFVFEKNADTDLTHYTSNGQFGNCPLVILP